MRSVSTPTSKTDDGGLRSSVARAVPQDTDGGTADVVEGAAVLESRFDASELERHVGELPVGRTTFGDAVTGKEPGSGQSHGAAT